MKAKKMEVLKYSSIRSREQLEIQVESETLNNKITGASTFSDLNKAKQDIAESTLAPSEKKKNLTKPGEQNVLFWQMK